MRPMPGVMASGAAIIELLRRHAWNASSFQLVERGFRTWFTEDGDGAVGFIQTRGARVVAGPPVTSEARLHEVAAAFVRDSAKRGRRTVFFGVEQRFLGTIGMQTLAVGLQPQWNPQRWTDRHRGHRGLKEQLRRARAKGVVTTRIGTDDMRAVRTNIEQLIERWLRSRPMPAMSFLVEITPFRFAEERRYYAATRGDALAGLLVAVPVYQRNGWFFEDIIRDPDAPNGTAELLIDDAMRDVAEDGATFVTLGLVPLAGEEPWQRGVRHAMRGFYNFDGLIAFRAKLRPESWDPIYIAWPEGSTFRAVADVLDAFAGGRLASFAARAVLRGPAPVLGALGALAIPWALLIATNRATRWFPSRAIQRAWVGFDLVMGTVLLSLALRWQRKLATAALSAMLLDSAVTLIEAGTYNVRRTRGWRDIAVVAVAVAAPILVSAVLIGRINRNLYPRATS